MKVLMTTDTIGGVWTYALQLCRALRPHGVSVVLATMGDRPTAAQRAEAAGLSNITLWESGYKLEWMQDPWADVAAAGEWLLGLEQRYAPDVVHLNGYAHAALPWRAPVMVVAHSCVLSWWQAVKDQAAPPEWNAYRHAVTRGLRDADLLVAPSQTMLAAIQRDYKDDVAAHRTRVIYNGRDATPYRQAAARAVKQPMVLSAGRLWDEAKNVGALERIAADLPWPVYVAGDETSPEGRSVRARQTKPLGRLQELELAGWFARASIYALPARYEPFGLSALEAAMAGCALVLGDIPSLREVWGDAALFAAPDDPGELRSALLSLIHDPARRRQLAERAIQRAARYTPQVMAQAYVDAYQSLMARGESATAAEGQAAEVNARPGEGWGETALGLHQPERSSCAS